MPDLRYYIRQLRSLPFREVVNRSSEIGKRLARDRALKVRDRILGTTLSDADFISRAFGGVFPDRQSLLAHFRSRTKPSFFIDRSAVKASLSGLSPSDRERITTDADKVCAHTFDLLGSGDVNLGATIDWQSDFKTDYRWNTRAYYKDMTIPFGTADIKVPWELSRFSHAVVLGQAYTLTGDERYAQEFAEQVEDWIDANKPKFGVNWACTMDVAIRACNWIAGYAFFGGSAALTDEFLLKFLKSLYQHGIHIRENLEYSESLTSNHYLSNITGLVYLGVMFPEFKEAGAWRTFGIGELVREMDKQVYPDGCDFEASTSYHRLVLELLFYPALAAVTNDRGFTGFNYADVADNLFGKQFRERLFRMFKAVLFLLKPDGMMPQIGDNDSGRLHVFARRSILDMRYLLCYGAIFFSEPKFKVRELGFCGEALWIFGPKGLAAWQALGERTLASVASHAFPNAGWYVMRNGRDYMIVSCGPNGQKDNGGHAHNDKLSFELSLDGKDVIVDPGTYLYTPDPDTRNVFRSTPYHNTVSVNGLEQNAFISGRLFTLGNDARATVKRWRCADDKDEFCGEHAGFAGSGFRHSREIRYDKLARTITVIDEISGKDPRSVASFHLRPGIEPSDAGTGAYRMDGATIAFSGQDRIDIEDAWHSAEYGRKEIIKCLKVYFGKRLETNISAA